MLYTFATEFKLVRQMAEGESLTFMIDRQTQYKKKQYLMKQSETHYKHR